MNILSEEILKSLILLTPLVIGEVQRQKVLSVENYSECGGTCKGECSGTCMSFCTGDCSGKCNSSCKGKCGSNCYNTCDGGCKDGCKNALR